MWTLTISERIASNSANFGTFVMEQLHLITHAKTGELIAMLVCREKRLRCHGQCYFSCDFLVIVIVKVIIFSGFSVTVLVTVIFFSYYYS